MIGLDESESDDSNEYTFRGKVLRSMISNAITVTCT